MGEFRALGLVHGHGIHGFDLVETARQYEAHPATTIVTSKGHAQHLLTRLLFIWQAQGNTDVAVHQAQTIVVTGHQHRSPLIPGLLDIDQASSAQHPANPLVQPFNAPRAFAHSTQQLEGFKALQHGHGPGFPARVIGWRAQGRTLPANDLQIAAVTLRAIVATAKAIQQQTVQGAILLTAQGQAKHVILRLLQQGTGLLGILQIDQPRQPADAAGFPEAPGKPQHHHLLGQRVLLGAAGLQFAACQGFTADALQPGLGLGAVTAGLGIPAQVTEYRACFHRGQLVLVSQQYQASMRRQCSEQVGHHLQVDHRRFVDHQYIQG
ncbi:hypothetical protein D3C77_346280 [compost metagenome]